jgi:hypothetical protein
MERSSMGHPRWQKSLRKLRLRAGLTEQALADRKDWVSKLAAALDCDAAELRYFSECQNEEHRVPQPYLM